VVVVVVGHGFGEQLPGPAIVPPRAAHPAAVLTTQVKAPIGDDCTQHWMFAWVVEVVELVDVEVEVLELVLVDVGDVEVVVGVAQLPNDLFVEPTHTRLQQL